MAKQLNTVNLTFNADTGKARQQLQELQTMLDKLVKGSIASSSKSQLPLTKELTEAQVAASKLQTILKQTTNVNTGNLDLTKFSESINRSGLSLNKLQTQLNSLGADGQKAFISLASSIVSADVPLTRTSKLATELWTTLKNTARWQLSSSVLHGFMGTIQSAYGYAQDLNESLNNIRIVTGQNTEQMARFAEQANRAAKELSATTTDYTNASLIYYQQGLDDNQVAERTNITIKMANAAGESAQKVSDQLTAVWNNFYEEGGKSLEYYADVMTALGAATASSTDEISEGLNKFASVAETVGLSYEYAASALATVTATTRQSADVVGTAFKTLFARIQDLELGETLEDGTTLGQYSEALNKVGVNIKDANGEIKEMDIILEEMAAKWDTLAKDQQIALAQSVAGVRQYTQLIALMDNWDFMKENLQVTAEAEGTLNEQAEIYAESWEAAKDRVRAAAEDIYDSLLDEDFFIGLLNGFEKVLTGVGNLVDAVGGLPGVLSMVGAVMTRVFSQQMAQAINNMVFGMKSLSGETRKTAEQMKQDAVNLATNMSFKTGTEAGDLEGQALQRRLELTQQIQNIAENLTAEEREQLSGLMAINDAYAEQAIAAAKLLDQQKQKLQEESLDARKTIIRNSDSKSRSVNIQAFQGAQTSAETKQFIDSTLKAKDALMQLNQELEDRDSIDQFKNSIKQVCNQLRELNQGATANDVGKLWQQFKDGNISVKEFKSQLTDIVTVENLVSDSSIELGDRLRNILGAMGLTSEQCDRIASRLIKVAEAQKNSTSATNQYTQSWKNLQSSVAGFNTAFNDFGQNVIKISQGISSLLMGFNSLKGAFEALSNPDLSFGEKTLQVFQSLTMAIPSLIMGYNALTTVKWKSVAAQWAEVKAAGAKVIADTAGLVAKWLNIAADKTHTIVIWNKVKGYFALNAVKSKTLALSLKLALVLVAVVAAIAAVVKIIDVLSDAYNKDALAAERSQEAAQNLATEYNNTKQAYEDMVAAMDNYKSATDALASMTKGTEEYRDALKEANEAALELISAGNLTKDDYAWEDGQLKIDEAALTRVKEEQANKVSKAYATSQMANIRASQAQNQADFTQLGRDLSADSISKYGKEGITAKEAESGIQKALEYIEKNGTSVLDNKDLIGQELNINDSGIIDALYSNSDAIKELSNNIESASALEEATQQQIANELMSGKGYENTQSGRKALEAGGEIYAAKEQASYDKWMKTNLADLGIGSMAGKDMWRKYAEEAGLNDLKGLKVNYKDDRVKYEYIDDEGIRQKKEVTKEEMAQILAAAEAAEQFGASMEVLKDKIGQLASSTEKADKALAEFLIDRNLGGTTKEEYDAIVEKVSTNGQIDNSKVDSYLGLTGDAQADLELAQNYGYNSAQEYKEAFIKSLNLEWNIPTEIGKDVADKLTANAADKINQNMADLGDKGGKAYVQMMDDAMRGIDWDKLTPEEAKEASEALANVDMSAWDAADQMIAIVGKYGNSVDVVTEKWKQNAEAVRQASGAVFDLDSWKTSNAEKQSVTKDLKMGDTISEEDFNKLGDAYSDYFELQNDGTFKLIANAEDLKAIIDGIDTQKALEGMQSEAGKMNQVQSYSNLTTDMAQSLVSSQDKGQNIGEENLRYLELYRQKVEEVYNVECASVQDAIDIMNQHNQQLSDSQGILFNSATSLQELQNLRAEVFAKTDSVDYVQYAEALMGLGAQYENCANEVENYRQKLIGLTDDLASNDASVRSAAQEQLASAEQMLNASILIGEAAEKYDLDAKTLEIQAKEIREAQKDLNGEYELTAEQAAALAIQNQRLNKGLSNLVDNWKDWKKVLKSTDKDSQDYAEALGDLSECVGDLVGWYEELTLDSKFVEKNMKLIDKAAKGEVGSIMQLAAAVASYTVEQAELNETLAEGKMADGDLNALQAYADKLGEGVTAAQAFAAAQTGVQAGFDAIANGMERLQNGASLADVLGGEEDLAAWVEQLNAYAAATGMTAQEMQTMLSSVGVTANVESDYQEQEMTVPTFREEVTNVHLQKVTGTRSKFNDDGSVSPIPYTEWVPEYTRASVPSEPLKTTGYVEVASISMVGPDGKTASPPKFTGRRAPSPSAKKGSGKKGGGGGGGSSAAPTKVEKTKKSDVVDRYKRVDDKLDDVAKKMNDASRAADRLYGKNRINQMKKVSEALEEEVNLLTQKRKEAEDYLKVDKDALKTAAKKAGITFTFDDKDNIKNYEQQMTDLYDRLAKAEAKADPSNFKTKEVQDAYIEKNITPLKEKIEELKKAISQYDETRELIEDLDDEAQEKFNEWQENNFGIWEESLELNLEVNDNALSELERKLEDLEDDFYSMAEAAALMIGNVVDGALNITGSQLDSYDTITENLTDKKIELDKKFANGDISQADYIEGLKTLKSEVEENSDNIKNLDDAMIHYYGDTLQAAQEELSQYTDLMSQHIEILEHYVNIMDIIGESTNYKKMGVILEGQAKVAENTMKVSKANYEMLNKQREARKAEYEAAMNSATDEELEVLKQKWLDAETAANDAQDQMIADTEAWAESLKAVLENKLAGFAQELENTLTGEWGSFDQMTAAMDRASSLQEEYLTNTNKIYETNKLMNKAQQDLDKTTNSVAKKRLQAYIDETQQLQNQAELSNYELEIQQAKYDLLLAEIALEEAQAAKSTVRLQRDSEGNFGYVYTADSSALAQAEQDLEDAQNSLYNIGLEGANDYTQKYQQTLSEMYDSLKELQEQYLSGSFESEQEYNDAVAAAKEYYYEKLKQYSNLYQVALTTDSNVIADAWSSDFNDMIYSTENWQTAVDDYLTQVEGAFTQWEAQIQQIKDETVGPNLEALAEKVEDITTENEELTEQITGEDGLIDALKDEIEQVNNITNAYINQRTEVLALRDANNALITSINSVIAAQANIDSNKNSDDEDISKNNNNNNNQNSNNNDNQNNNTGDNIDFNKIKIGSEIEVASGSRWYNDSYGAGPTGPARSGTIKSVNIKGSHPYNIEGLGWISKSDIKKINRYNTGGYTGDWGPEGKLGILDEKELVLNKNDTANFLASMEILDKILQAIDLQTLNSQIGGILSSPSFGNLETKTLEQQVTIEANFPGVSVASEIEEAFGNLVNLASQYANRK